MVHRIRSVAVLIGLTFIMGLVGCEKSDIPQVFAKPDIPVALTWHHRPLLGYFVVDVHNQSANRIVVTVDIYHRAENYDLVHKQLSLAIAPNDSEELARADVGFFTYLGDVYVLSHPDYSSTAYRLLSGETFERVQLK